MVKPISPNEVNNPAIPEEVIEAFNFLIKKNFRNGSATILQNEVIEKILKIFRQRRREMTRQQIFDAGWLNIEHLYTNAGWNVGYDKTAYNETYDAFFTFKKKKRISPH